MRPARKFAASPSGHFVSMFSIAFLLRLKSAPFQASRSVSSASLLERRVPLLARRARFGPAIRNSARPSRRTRLVDVAVEGRAGKLQHDRLVGLARHRAVGQREVGHVVLGLLGKPDVGTPVGDLLGRRVLGRHAAIFAGGELAVQAHMRLAEIGLGRVALELLEQLLVITGDTKPPVGDRLLLFARLLRRRLILRLRTCSDACARRAAARWSRPWPLLLFKEICDRNTGVIAMSASAASEPGISVQEKVSACLDSGPAASRRSG